MSETTNTSRISHPEIQRKMAAIMEQDERAASLIKGFVMAYETLQSAYPIPEPERKKRTRKPKNQ